MHFTTNQLIPTGLLFALVVLLGCSVSEPDVELSTAGDDAYALLAKSTFFGAYNAGFVPTPSAESAAFVSIYDEPEEARASAFERLVKEGTTAGRLYGLSGLYLTDRPRFEKLAASFRNSGEEVESAGGCVLFQARVSELVLQIGDGSIPNALIEAGRAERTR